MTYGDMGSRAILNPYDPPYLPLKFEPLITNRPVCLHIESDSKFNVLIFRRGRKPQNRIIYECMIKNDKAVKREKILFSDILH